MNPYDNGRESEAQLSAICSGCGEQTRSAPGVMALITPHAVALVCAKCSRHANADPGFKRTVEMAAHCGTTAARVTSLFAGLGFPVPVGHEDVGTILRSMGQGGGQ